MGKEKPAEDFVSRKTGEIMASRLSEARKRAYIEKLNKKEEAPDAITLDVYFRVKKIMQSRRAGMAAYPKAVEVKSATIAQWDTVFANY